MNDGSGFVISDYVICGNVICSGDSTRIVDHRGLSAVVTIWSAPQILRAGVPPRARSTS
jgi:hypothetical protein